MNNKTNWNFLLNTFSCLPTSFVINIYFEKKYWVFCVKYRKKYVGFRLKISKPIQVPAINSDFSLIPYQNFKIPAIIQHSYYSRNSVNIRDFLWWLHFCASLSIIFEITDHNSPFFLIKHNYFLIFKVPTPRKARLFSFMNPLAADIWMYVFSAYVLVSATMFVVARFSPHEWHNPHPCEVFNELLENQFSLANSFWFTIGTLMQQGSDLNPKVGKINYTSSSTLIIANSTQAKKNSVLG